MAVWTSLACVQLYLFYLLCRPTENEGSLEALTIKILRGLYRLEHSHANVSIGPLHNENQMVLNFKILKYFVWEHLENLNQFSPHQRSESVLT